MFNKVATPIALLALASSAAATVYTTSPTAQTTWTGGQPATISWIDDGVTPSLEEFGVSRISIYVGNAQQQTLLQAIADDVDVSQQSSIEFTPDPSIGPDSDEYFIRFESTVLRDAEAPQFPALAFSAKFALTGMSGEFNASVEAQIAGQSTAPLAGPTGQPSGSDSDSVSPTSSRSSTSSTSSRTSSGTAAEASNTEEANDNAGFSVKAGWFGVILSVAAGVALF